MLSTSDFDRYNDVGKADKAMRRYLTFAIMTSLKPTNILLNTLITLIPTINVPIL